MVCDYEVLTDRYASSVGLVYSLVKEEDKKVLKEICSTVYHANPCVRNENSITSDDIENLIYWMEKYNEYVPKYFILPLDNNEISGRLHVLRSEAKQIVRMLYKIQREEGREIFQNVFDVFNITSQIMFGLAMKYSESPEQFYSRTYK